MAEMGFYEVRGLRLAWHAWGPRDAPIALLIHGFLDHGLSFAATADRLAGPFRVIAPDIRGHGHSGWVGAGGYYHFQDYYHDLHTLIASLDPRHLHLVGHSMGGMIASGLGALFAERVASVVLLDGMGPPSTPPERLLERLRNWTESLDARGFGGDEASRRAARRPMESVAEAAARLQFANPRLALEHALRLATTGTEPWRGGAQVVWRHDPLHRTPSPRPFRTEDGMPLWRALTMPVLSIYTELGEWTPKDLPERHAALPRVTRALVPGAGHNLHHERPEWLAEVLRAWWQAPGDVLPTGLQAGEPAGT